MAYESATNPTTGEKLFLVDNKWVPSSETATNPETGQRAFLVNNEWQVLDVPKATPTAAPATEVAPISSPEEITSQAETSRGAFAAQPGAGLTEQQKRQLAEATAKYETEVPFLQRQTDPIKAGVKGLSTVVPNLEITSLQKEINAIREGKVGPRDPVTGEMTPLQPEEAEAAIKSLQARQAEAQKKVMGVQAEVSQIRKRPAVELLNDVTTARQAFQAFQADPLGIMASVSLESLPQVAPALVLGAVTRNPTVGALAMGSTSFASELSSGVMEYFQDNGVDTRDPVAVNKALNDPVLFAKAYGHALTRGSIIAAADTAAAGLASKMLVPKQLIKNQLAKEAVNIGVAQPAAQIISGGGGEIFAQLATEGEVKKPGRAVLEAAGEGPTSLLETAAFGGQQAYERLPSTIEKREQQAKAVKDQKKILDKLSAPGALDNLGQQFNETVEKLKASVNPDTNQPYTEQEAYAVAGDAILQGGLLDGTESTIGGADQSGVSVSGKPIETDTGAIDTTGGDLAATSTTTTAVGSGEGTQLNTLAADLKAKYNLTDEQATAAATESLRQKQVAAQQQAAGAGTPTPPAITVPQNLVDLYAKSIAAEEANSISSSPANKRNATMASRRLIEAQAAYLGFTKADYLKEIDSGAIRALDDAIIDAYDKQQTPQDTTDTTEDTKPPVKTGKPRGRPVTTKTPEQIAAADAYKKQRQDIGRNASNDINRAEKVLTQEVNTEQIINNAANEDDAISQLSQLKLQRIGALETAYRLSVDPDQKNKTAGKRASTLLEAANPKELEAAKQIYKDKQKIGAPSRSAMTAQDLKDKQQLEATKRRLALQKPISIFTEAFKKWFGNSKIVNKDGTPKRMYHGTARDISEFKGKQANAIFLTDDPVFAEGFTSMSEDYMVKNIMEEQGLTPKKIEELQNKAKKIADRDGTSFNDVYYNLLREQLPSRANIIPVYVKAENPFDYENPYHIEAVINALTPKERDTALADVSFSPDRLVSTIARGSWVTIESAPIQAAIRRAGFDAFQVWEGNRKNLAVYNSNQVKSVFNQAPTEDANISRAQRLESTNGQDNTAFEKFDYAKGAVNFIAQNGNPFERVLAKRLLPFLNGVKFVVVDSPDDMPTTFLRDKMAGAAGLYVPDRKTIYVMRDGGINNTVVLHEALHAATVDRIDTYLRLSELKEGYTPIPPSLSVPVLELMYTMDAAKQNYDRLKVEALESGNLGVLTQDMLDIPEEAFTDIKEFVAYGMSLPAMQEFLIITPGNKEITYAGEPPGFIDRLFTRFVQNIRQLFDMDEKHTSALQDLIIVTDKLLSAPLPEMAVESGEPVAAKAKQPAPPKVPKPPKQLKMIESLLRKIRLSNRNSTLNGSIGELIMQVRNANDAIRLMKAIYGAISVTKLKLALKAFTTEDITRIAGDKINNLKVINNAVDDMAGMRVQMIRELSEKTPAWINFNEKYEEGGNILADLINASTLLEVDPTKHPDATTAIKNDPKLQRIENDILNPSTDPKTLPNLKKQRTERTAAIKLVYEGGAYNNPVTGEKYTMGGWEQLGKFGKGEGHAIYKMAKDSYKKTFDMHEQLLKEKIEASNVPGDVNDASTPKGKLIAAITKTFQEAKLLEVYFPLMRYGNFWFSVGKGKSGEFYMFEGEVARNNAIETRVAELNKAGDKRTRDQMIADGDIDIGNDIRKLREKHIESSDMLKEIFAMLDQNKMSDIDAVKDNIYQMYLMTLPDKDIRRKFVHRQGKTGFSADAIRNFIVSQHTAANQLARLKYSDKIRNGIAAAYAEIQQNPDKLKLATIIREISNRAINEITPTVPEEGLDWDQVASIGNKFVFYWLLTSPKSALVQMTQLPIVGLPTLGAEFGIGKATATAARYGALWNKFGTTKKDENGNVITEWGQPSINDSKYVNEHKNLAYRKVLKDAWNFANDKDIFMSTYAGDMTAMSAAPSTRYQGLVERGTRFTFNLMGGAFHHAERISREIMFMSSFELAYADYKGKGLNDKAAFDAATEKALKLTYDALFNYTQYNKPPPMKTAGGRLAFQFLTYPLQMTSYLVRNFYGMLPFLNKEEKKEAAIKFFGTLGMTGLFAGVTGFPLYSFIMGMTDGIRELMRDEEDEDYDEDDEGNPLGRRSTDLWFRNWFIPNYFGPDSSLANFFNLTEEQAATLSRGVEMGPISAYTDLNIGTSTSLDGLWFRSDSPAETSREAFINFAFSFTGPIGSVGANFAGAYDDWNKGQVSRAFEKLSPAWLKGGLTAMRLKEEGATTTKGDELMNPEFYTTGKLLAQTLGFGSTEVAQVQKANFMAKKIVTQINREKQNILNRLDVAVRKDDDDEIDEILEEIDKFNTKNAMLAINGETVSKSLQSRAERRGKAYQGLSVSDKEAPFVYPLVEGTRSPQYK